MYVRHLVGGGPGVKPAGLPLLACSYNNTFIYIYIYIYIVLTTTKFGVPFRFVGVGLQRRSATRFGRDLHQIWWATFFFFEISVTGPHWEFSHCHVAAHDWATWQPNIGPRHSPVQSPCHVTCLPHHPATYGTDATCLPRPIRPATWLYGLPHGTSSLVHMLT
jgi:hypothetical protein